EEGIPCESCGNLIPFSEFEKHNAEHQRDIDNARAAREAQPKANAKQPATQPQDV
ncbi:MAG: hypothetical protein EZS28_036836, partial [Streblomastix strix]